MRRAFRYAISILVAYLRHANSLHKTQIPAIEITGYLCQMPKGINLPYRTLCRPSWANYPHIQGPTHLSFFRNYLRDYFRNYLRDYNRALVLKHPRTPLTPIPQNDTCTYRQQHVYLLAMTRVLIGNDTCTYWQRHVYLLAMTLGSFANTPRCVCRHTFYRPLPHTYAENHEICCHFDHYLCKKASLLTQN